MKLSTRLTRAGAAFVVFGIVASAVPNSGMIPAGACGGSSNNTGAYVAGAVVLGAGAYALANPSILHPGAKKTSGSSSDTNTPENTSNTPTTPTTNTQWNDLHNFVYGS